MAQLTIDVDRALMEMGSIPPSARSTRFAEHFEEGKSLEFQSYRKLGFSIYVSRDNIILTLNREALQKLQEGDRVLLTIRGERRFFQVFDGAASMVQHILAHADPEFIQSIPIELPAYLSTEVGFNLPEKKDMLLLARVLFKHMIVKYSFLGPPLLGFSEYIENIGNVLEIDGEKVKRRLVERDDAACRRALIGMIEEITEIMPQLGFQTLDLNLIAERIREGRPFDLLLWSESR